MSDNRRVNPLFLMAPMVVLLPLVWVLASSFGNNPRAVPSMLVGKQAPQFELKGVSGNAFALRDHANSPVVINFWSTWCVPCKIEHPLLLAAPKNYPDVTFVGVVYGDTEAKVRNHLRREGQSYPQLFDPGGRVAIDYGVAGVPETFFVNTKGEIFHKHSGALNRRVLDALISQARTP